MFISIYYNYSQTAVLECCVTSAGLNRPECLQNDLNSLRMSLLNIAYAIGLAAELTIIRKVMT